MDDETVKDYEMQSTNEDNDDPTDIEEDYTLLEGETIIIDDDSDEVVDYIYQEALDKKESLDNIKEQLRERDIKDKAKTVATLRNQLYDLHSKFVERGYVDKSGLKTFLELGKIYEDAGGDDIYHDKLKPEIMNLPISGDDK